MITSPMGYHSSYFASLASKNGSPGRRAMVIANPCHYYILWQNIRSTRLQADL